MIRLQQIVRRDSTTPGADFWQRVRIGLAVALAITVLKWGLR